MYSLPKMALLHHWVRWPLGTEFFHNRTATVRPLGPVRAMGYMVNTREIRSDQEMMTKALLEEQMW